MQAPVAKTFYKTKLALPSASGGLREKLVNPEQA
jgi:hypothetical protein